MDDSSSELMKNDIISTLEEYSDFSFEMKVLKLVNDLRYQTEHSGTYLDYYTKVNREFDIRARKKVANYKYIKLAIECKNLSNEAPVVIHCVPAMKRDLCHSIMIEFNKSQEAYDKKFPPGPVTANHFRESLLAHVVAPRTMDGGNIFGTLYDERKFIGKSLDRVVTKNKGMKNEKKVLDDQEVYVKYNQAVNSLVDLIVEAKDTSSDYTQTLLLPVLVVPDGSLWEVRYNSDGARDGEPFKADRIPFYISKYFNDELGSHFPVFRLWYLEIVTVSGLEQLLKDIEGDYDHGNSPSFIQNSEAQEIISHHMNRFK